MFWLRSITIAVALVGFIGVASAQTPTAPTQVPLEERNNISAFLKGIDVERDRQEASGAMSGCEGTFPDRKNRDAQGKPVPAIHRGQVLTAFPFVTVTEFSGEAPVPVFRTKHGKLSADHRSTIRVCFDPTKLAADPVYSQGDLSLAAQIGDRAVSVEGYAEIGKNYEKFKPSAIRPVTYGINYATIQSRVSQGSAAFAKGEVDRAVDRARTVGEVFGSMIDGHQISYVTARITETSEPELKARLKALRDTLKTYDAVKRDQNLDVAQIDVAIDQTKKTITAVEQELLAAALRQAEVQSDPNADAKKKDEARLQSEQLGALALRRRAELKDLQARKFNTQGGAALLTKAQDAVNAALVDVGALFHLNAETGGAKIYMETTNLRDGQIFLRKEDAKPGDVLRISLLHFAPDFGAAAPDQTANTPVAETLAEITIDNYGWRSEVADSFLLVKSRDSDVSNFKGAAGVSLLYSLNPRHVAGNPLLNTIRAVSPSIGANVSYLDFSDENDIEIGAGVVVGLFSNMIHTGVGWNLNYAGNREYVFLGFSFGKIKDRITGTQPQ